MAEYSNAGGPAVLVPWHAFFYAFLTITMLQLSWSIVAENCGTV